jgi:hypothetical protein
MRASTTRRFIHGGLLSLLLLPAPAWAVTRLSEIRVHGTSCTLQAGSLGNPQRDFTGLLNNDFGTSNSMVILCPIPRTTYLNATIRGTCNGSSTPAPYVDLIDGNPSRDIGCNLIVFDANNNFVRQVFASSSGTSAAKRVTFNVAATTLGSGFRLAVECVIPSAVDSGAQASGIIGITVPICESSI